MIIAAAVALVIAGCSGSPAHSSADRRTVAANESADGSTIRVSVGTALRVTLHSTYWHFDADASPGIVRRSAIVTQPDTSAPRIPGSGRGTLVAVFSAVAPGTAAIRATRTSCGEALRCVGSQGSFQLTVVVR